jgi:hypothetical protein
MHSRDELDGDLEAAGSFLRKLVASAQTHGVALGIYVRCIGHFQVADVDVFHMGVETESV